ncbi:TetR/AcrR family transcriptional regulator [Streptomyces sp. NPDC054887]
MQETTKDRRTQADRRLRTRTALLESAARGLSRFGYGNLVLEQVAKDAGYTRGALYHQFKDKQELTLAVIDWVMETWDREVGRSVEQQPDPVAALLTLARGHAVSLLVMLNRSKRAHSRISDCSLRGPQTDRGPHPRFALLAVTGCRAKFNISVICLRIGSFEETATEACHLATWLNPQRKRLDGGALTVSPCATV